MSGWGIALVIAATMLGAFVQGSVGFGHNLIAAPAMAFVDDRFVPGPAILGAMLLTALMLFRDRHGVHLGEVRTALLGRIPATVVAALTVAFLPARGLAVLFAVLVLVAVAISASGVHLRPTPGRLLGAGALSGFMATTTSIGGPPMAMLYASEEGRRMRGTLAGFFLVGSFMSVGALLATGSFGADSLRLSLLQAPGIAVGFAASALGVRHLDAGHTRPAVLAVSVLGAVSVLVKSVL
ncbi:TSUP family transporter [Actinospongicola halichondriae]|uniref:TSUP family transporter n=1 Tax=Actinospongicola halichondriae TaxID=3236844 RepID=UPI003D5B36B4